MLVNSIEVLSFNPAFCCSIDWRSPRIWRSINHTYLSLFLFKWKRHMKKICVSFCLTQMKLCRKSSIRPTLFTFSFLTKECQNLVFFKVNHMQEQGCSGGLEITGINNLPSPTKQEPGKAPWVVFCTSTYELGVF